MFVLKDQNQTIGSVILNHQQDLGYEDANWLVNAKESEVMVIHTLAIAPL